MWDTSRFESEPAIDTWGWDNVPGNKRQEPGHADRRVRRAYRAYVSTMDSLGWAAFYLIAFGVVYRLWGFV